MAIDDNTVYGLTGAQVKELPGKIEAVKGLARDLTPDDYDWPTDNPVRVALWKLPSGIYTHSQANIAISNDSNAGYNQYLIFVDSTDQVATDILLFNHNEMLLVDKVRKSDGYSYGRRTFLESTDVINNLTSTSTTNPLSAAQGKALKDLIDAIQVPTKTSDLTNDSNFVTSTQMDTALADKADTNDIPTALSELTNDINAVSDANYVHTDNNYTTPEKTKLAGIASGAEVNVQSDWAETDSAADSYIQNKPTIPTAVSELTNDAGYTTNTGTITGVSVNGTSIAASGVADIRPATTSRYGVTLLSTSTSSTSTTTAATPSAVRTAYNLADSKATITMTATDPGEGAALAANNFVAVYGTMGTLLDMFYPIGSYYETSDASFDPNTAWGGTWVEDSGGQVTAAYQSGDSSFGTVGQTGGTKFITHVTSLPINSYQYANGSGAFSDRLLARDTGLQNGIETNAQLSTLQPYVVVKRWHRTN